MFAKISATIWRPYEILCGLVNIDFIYSLYRIQTNGSNFDLIGRIYLKAIGFEFKKENFRPAFQTSRILILIGLNATYNPLKRILVTYYGDLLSGLKSLGSLKQSC